MFNLDFCGGGLESKSDGSMLEMTVLTEAEDLNAVIDHFKNDPRFTKLFLMGFSQGGFVSSYVAAQRPEDAAGPVLEYPACVLQDDARKRALPDGAFPATSNVMGQTIGRVYNEAAVSFDVYDVIGGYTGKALILHGDQDGIVPLEIFRQCGEGNPKCGVDCHSRPGALVYRNGQAAGDGKRMGVHSKIHIKSPSYIVE